MKNKFLAVCKHISLGIAIQAICFNCCFAQCPTHQQFWDKIIALENSSDGTDKKLTEALLLKKQFETCGFEKDSVYARILHRIGSFQYFLNLPDEAIKNTFESIRINMSGKRGSCASFTTISFFNIGFYYMRSLKYNQAIVYFDSSIIMNHRFPGNDKYVVLARLYGGNIYYKKGNYEEDIEETSLGLQLAEKLKDTTNIVALLLERAQSYIMQKKFTTALNDIDKCIFLLKNLKKYDSWANALRYKADIIAEQHNCKDAFNLYKQSIEYRKLVDANQTAVDYNDAGLLLFKNCNNNELAKKYFDTAYKMGLQLGYDFVCALATYNLGEMSFNKGDYKKALEQNQQSQQYLFSHRGLNNLLANPPYTAFSTLDSKNLAENILSSKSKFLLYLYKQTNDLQFLKSSVSTALLNDSVITDLRHEQTGEQSKLYWRNDTRDFFTNAIEACYLDNNPEKAFYFIEKSRAVLLNDKLNELGAAVHLPKKESIEQESLQENIAIEQQKLSQLNDTNKEYAMQQNKLLQAKENFDHYIKSLEQKYPAYYQYKYDDNVPSLKSLQQYLAKNNQSFVHYFIGDTVTYILAVTSNNTNLIRLSQKDFNKEQLVQFLQLCTNKQALNNHYDSFAQLSNSIYKKIFERLQLPKGRIIICTDNILIPFEALCSDESGKHFLINDYSFSYVYSARFLLKQFNNATATGSFLGFAPVSFASYLGVQKLNNAAEALHTSGKYYENDKLFTHENATKHNFFQYASSYSIVSIFSHARADTTDTEPELFMQDSVIHLSELQLLNNPATKLVLLSACQTNVGKAATGEGIYSLARGFATAGIPSVAATLWKADEQTIYDISAKFNEYLAQGMNKDEALQKAKLYFIQNNSHTEKLLPFYWANMIVIGNMDAIKFTQSFSSSITTWHFIYFCITLTIVLIFIYTKRKLLTRKRLKRVA